MILDNVGWTAMHYVISFTIEKKLRTLVPFLIKTGFDVNDKNQKGQTVLDLARERKNSKAILFLEKAIKEASDCNNNWINIIVILKFKLHILWQVWIPGFLEFSAEFMKHESELLKL